MVAHDLPRIDRLSCWNAVPECFRSSDMYPRIHDHKPKTCKVQVAFLEYFSSSFSQLRFFQKKERTVASQFACHAMQLTVVEL